MKSRNQHNSEIKHSNIIQARGWCAVLFESGGQYSTTIPTQHQPIYVALSVSRVRSMQYQATVLQPICFPPGQRPVNLYCWQIEIVDICIQDDPKMHQTSGTLRQAKWIQMANPSEKRGGTNHIFMHRHRRTTGIQNSPSASYHIYKPWSIDLCERVGRQCALMRYSFNI